MPVGLVTPAASILSPGIGPNGPGPIDMQRRITSIGEGSSVPYGSSFGYATPNLVTGLLGPAAGSLRQPTSWYVRAAGSNLNGGSSSGLAADRSGSDGATTSGSLTFTSVSAAFTQADIGKGICVQNATRCYAKITSINSATSVQLSNPPSATASGLSWSIGGAWATPEPVLNCSAFANTTCGVQSGDSVYVGAGTYRVTYAIGSNFGSTWKPTGTTVLNPIAYYNGVANILGDVAGQFTGDAGMVQFTAYTTNDKTVPVATTLLNLSLKSNLGFSNIMFVGGTGNPTTINTSTVTPSQNISLVDCVVHSIANITNGAITVSAIAGGQYLNWLIDRCILFGKSNVFAISSSQAALGSGAVNLGFIVQNSLLVAGLASSNGPILITGTASTGRQPGGGIIRNCHLLGGSGTVLQVQNAAYSTAVPVQVFNCLIMGGTGLSANALGQILENWNEFSAGTPRTNVSTGANSDTNVNNPLFHFGQERIWGALLRPFGEPMAGSPMLAFGSDGAQTLYDLYNRPRPAGGGSFLPAVGALERSNTLVQAQAPTPPSGTNIWQTTGPGYQDLLLPISAVADGFSIVVQRDAAYSPGPGRTNPALVMLPNETIGVAGQTVVDSGGSGSWNTLTLQSFTPTATGWVTLRLISYDGSGASVVSFANASPS